MLWIFIDSLKEAIRWIRWIRIVWFCRSIVVGRVKECDENWITISYMGNKNEVRCACRYDLCPRMRER